MRNGGENLAFYAMVVYIQATTTIVSDVFHSTNHKTLTMASMSLLYLLRFYQNKPEQTSFNQSRTLRYTSTTSNGMNSTEFK